MPLDSLRVPLVPSKEPELVENARPRSTPGMITDVKRPWPLQNNKIDWATLAGWKNKIYIFLLMLLLLLQYIKIDFLLI